VDWSEGKWHPKSYEKGDVTEATLQSIQVAFCIFSIAY
jgi:hypothetical protein